jgi:hypothetical protein
MKDIKERFEENYLLGCIKHKSEYAFYLMPIAWWILNHDKYDPDHKNRKSQFVFRDNINNVLSRDIAAFIKSVEEDKLDNDDLRKALSIVSPEYTYLYFYIDFDNKIFVSAFPDIEVEEYLPEDGWVGKFDNPVNYLPDDLIAIVKR